MVWQRTQDQVVPSELSGMLQRQEADRGVVLLSELPELLFSFR